MIQNGKTASDRRQFLRSSAAFVLGTLFGLHGVPEALAFTPPKSSAGFHPKISLIIDDIGYSRSRARQFLALGVPITFSILPRLEKSRDLALEIGDHGHEIMLHQPMEPYNARLDPGPGALYVGYEAAQIAGIVEANITSIPHAIGVNNHMGSKFTSHRHDISEALRVVKESGLFFIDSLTSNRSQAYQVARNLHMTAASRNIFLDNRVEETAILYQLAMLERHACKYGRAVGIGHPFPQTAAAIDRFLKERRESGVSLVHISKVL